MPPRRKKRKLSRVARRERVGRDGDVIVSTIQLLTTFKIFEITLDTHRNRLLFTNYGLPRGMSLVMYDLNTGLTTPSGAYPWQPRAISLPTNSDAACGSVAACNCGAA